MKHTIGENSEQCLEAKVTFAYYFLGFCVFCISALCGTLHKQQQKNKASVIALAEVAQIQKDRLDAMYKSHFSLMGYISQHTMSFEESEEFKDGLIKIQEDLFGEESKE